MTTAQDRWNRARAKLMKEWPPMVEARVVENAVALATEVSCPRRTAVAALAAEYSKGYNAGQRALSDAIEAREEEERREELQFQNSRAPKAEESNALPEPVV